MRHSLNLQRPLICAALLGLSAVASLSLGCASSPEVRYYKLALPEAEANAEAPAPAVSIAIEYLTSDAAYDDERIVYRQSPYRLDYYFYHRWSAPPSVLVTDALRQSFLDSGRFISVTGGYTARTDVILSGRLVALEEVDKNEEDWSARLILDLQLHRTRDGELLWSKQLRRQQEVTTRSPEGVAEALSLAAHALSQELIQELEPIARAQREAQSAPAMTNPPE